MRNWMGPILIGTCLGISTAVIGVRLHGIYKECKIEAPKHMVRCMFIKDNAE